MVRRERRRHSRGGTGTRTTPTPPVGRCILRFLRVSIAAGTALLLPALVAVFGGALPLSRALELASLPGEESSAPPRSRRTRRTSSSTTTGGAAAIGEDEFRAKVSEALGGRATGPPYGVDASFPAHHRFPSCWTSDDDDDDNCGGFPDRAAFYDAYLEGCRLQNGGAHKSECDRSERERRDACLHQPREMRNYTDVGFAVVPAPRGLRASLARFWGANNKNGERMEAWAGGSAQLNHWESPTYSLSLEDASLPGGGEGLRSMIWDAAEEALKRWTGLASLNPSSLYGIRSYRQGAIVAPRVDPPPLVLTAVISVGHDVEEPWPLEVIAHDGRAYNVTLDEGEMVLLEGHSIIHGRPFPLVGNRYSEIFVHFEPPGFTSQGRTESSDLSYEDLYRRALEKVKAKEGLVQVIDKDKEQERLPTHILKGSLEEKRWKQRFVRTSVADKEVKKSPPPPNKKPPPPRVPGATPAHTAANKGDYLAIKAIAADPERRGELTKQDKNGWQPLHEAARGGYVDIVELLVEEGADVNARTNNGNGGTVLWWAEKSNGEDSEVSKALKRLGAIKKGPGK